MRSREKGVGLQIILRNYFCPDMEAARLKPIESASTLVMLAIPRTTITMLQRILFISIASFKKV